MTCTLCHEPFISKATAKYCYECKDKVMIKRRRELQKLARARKRIQRHGMYADSEGITKEQGLKILEGITIEAGTK